MWEGSKGPSPSLEKVDLSYIAGFFDGEGCVSIHICETWYKRKDGRVTQPPYPQMRVAITNTNKPILEWIKELIGGRIKILNRASEKHKTGYSLAWQRKDEMLFVLTALLPYLRLKKRQAELGIQFLRSPRRVRGDEPDMRKMEAAQLIKSLNKKGPPVPSVEVN